MRILLSVVLLLIWIWIGWALLPLSLIDFFGLTCSTPALMISIRLVIKCEARALMLLETFAASMPTLLLFGLTVFSIHWGMPFMLMAVPLLALMNLYTWAVSQALLARR